VVEVEHKKARQDFGRGRAVDVVCFWDAYEVQEVSHEPKLWAAAKTEEFAFASLAACERPPSKHEYPGNEFWHPGYQIKRIIQGTVGQVGIILLVGLSPHAKRHDSLVMQRLTASITES
jgi:hypothetical protein